MKYKVKLVERHSGTFEIEADSEEQAIEKAIETCVVEYEVLLDSYATPIED